MATIEKARYCLDEGNLFWQPMQWSEQDFCKAIDAYRRGINQLRKIRGQTGSLNGEEKLLEMEIRNRLVLTHLTGTGTSKWQRHLAKAYVHHRAIVDYYNSIEKTSTSRRVNDVAKLLAQTLSQLLGVEHWNGRVDGIRLGLRLLALSGDYRLLQLRTQLVKMVIHEVRTGDQQLFTESELTSGIALVIQDREVKKLIDTFSSRQSRLMALQPLINLTRDTTDETIRPLAEYTLARLNIAGETSMMESLESLLRLAAKKCAHADLYLWTMDVQLALKFATDEALSNTTTCDWLLRKLTAHLIDCHGRLESIPSQLIRTGLSFQTRLNLLSVMNLQIFTPTSFDGFGLWEVKKELTKMKFEMVAQDTLPYDLMNLVTSYLPWYDECD